MPYAFIPFIAIIVIGLPIALIARSATNRRAAGPPRSASTPRTTAGACPHRAARYPARWRQPVSPLDAG